jgi:two-component system cell cycle response regulator
VRRHLPIAVRSLLVLAALGSLAVALMGFSQLDAADGILAGTGVAALGLSLALLRLVGIRSPQEPLELDALTCLPTRRQLLRDLARAIRSSRDGQPRMLVLIDLIGFKQYNDTFGRPAGDALLLRLGHNLARVVAARGTAYRLDGAEFAALVTVESDTAMLAEFVAGALEEDGEGFSISTSYGIAIVPQEAASPEQAMRVANERLYALTHTLRAAARTQATEEVLMRALDKRSSEHGDWVQGLGELVEAVAQRLELPAEELERVRIAAALHDVGKSAVPSTILEKRFPLDRDERDFVERHPLVGERILHAAPALTRVAQLVRWTHERYDGSGYPDRLPGSEIPLGARIIAVCDAFDAMISKRPYRLQMTPDEAIAELRRCAGSQFDPNVVEAFCAVMEERERFFAAA